MSGTLHPATMSAEDLERQTGNQARDLARAITRIGELDCTRTLPGRHVWYPPKCVRCGRMSINVPRWLPVVLSCAECWDAQLAEINEAHDARRAVLDVDTALANGDSR